MLPERRPPPAPKDPGRPNRSAALGSGRLAQGASVTAAAPRWFRYDRRRHCSPRSEPPRAGPRVPGPRPSTLRATVRARRTWTGRAPARRRAWSLRDDGLLPISRYCASKTQGILFQAEGMLHTAASGPCQVRIGHAPVRGATRLSADSIGLGAPARNLPLSGHRDPDVLRRSHAASLPRQVRRLHGSGAHRAGRPS